MSFFTFFQQVFTGHQGQTTLGVQQGSIASRSLPFTLPRATRASMAHAKLIRFTAKETPPVSAPINSKLADLNAKLALVPNLRAMSAYLSPSEMTAELDKQLQMTAEEKGLSRCGMDPAAILDVVVRRLEMERIAARPLFENRTLQKTA